MSKILHYLLSKLPIVKKLDGHKTLIGACFIVAGSLIEALGQIAPLFPEAAWIPQAEGSLKDLLASAKSAADLIGMSFLYVGLTHKAVKAKLPEDE